MQQRATPRTYDPAVRAAGGPDALAVVVVLAAEGGGQGRGILLTLETSAPVWSDYLLSPVKESVMELVQSVLAIVAFVRAGKYADAAIIAFRLAAQLLEQLTGPNVVGACPDDCKDKTCEELCDVLEATVNAKGVVDDLGAMPPILIPLLLLLAQKIIERLLK